MESISHSQGPPEVLEYLLSLLLKHTHYKSRATNSTHFTEFSADDQQETTLSRESSYPIDLCETLTVNKDRFYAIFNQLYEQYEDTDLTKKSEGKCYLHKIAIDQFWLTCFTSRKDFMKKLQAPLKNNIWVDSDLFLHCIDGVHRMNRSFLTALGIHQKSYRSEYRIQKLIFFFCIILLGEKAIPTEKIEEVFILSKKNFKTELYIDSLVGTMLGKSTMTHMTIEEFLYKVTH